MADNNILDVMHARKTVLDVIYKTNHVRNNPEKALVHAHRGLDALQVNDSLPVAQDDLKLIFFTRPQLNLTSRQLLRSPKLIPYLNGNKNSVERYVRLMLDPRLHYDVDDQTKLSSDLVDMMNPFIPILSNSLISMTGWPDSVVPTYTSKPGIKKETITIMDGVTDIYSDFDLDATFQNTTGEAILKLISTWTTVGTKCFANELAPYMDFLLEFEKDYETRIYVVVLASNRRTVKRIGCTGASIPITNPDGKFFDFTRETAVKGENNDFTIRFKSTGAMYNDPEIVEDFNLLMEIFNPHMAMLNAGDSNHGLVKVPQELHPLTNSNMYPRINLQTNELEWYCLEEYLSEIEETS